MRTAYGETALPQSVHRMFRGHRFSRPRPNARSSGRPRKPHLPSPVIRNRFLARTPLQDGRPLPGF